MPLPPVRPCSLPTRPRSGPACPSPPPVPSAEDFPEIEESGVKIYTDKDGFQYSVSVPDYLLWNGNLAIAESDVRYALIIWIKPFHQGISQGVLFNDYKDLNTQIMLSSSKKAEDQEDQWIVDENSTILTTIFEKANKVWNLGLK